MKTKNVGRPRLEENFKRSRSLLLRMRPSEYDKIAKKYEIARTKDDGISSLNDFIIKVASGMF